MPTTHDEAHLAQKPLPEIDYALLAKTALLIEEKAAKPFAYHTSCTLASYLLFFGIRMVN